jgi:hypothetical protein
MKIIPNEQQKPIIPSTATQHGDRSNTGSGFAKVLNETVQKPSGAVDDNHNVMRPSMASAIGRATVSESSEISVAQGLLDALEDYQNLIGDPRVSLKMVEPCVEKMRLLSQGAESILERFPDGHPLKLVVGEALVHISKEMERFNGGYYVDR